MNAEETEVLYGLWKSSKAASRVNRILQWLAAFTFVS